MLPPKGSWLEANQVDLRDKELTAETSTLWGSSNQALLVHYNAGSPDLPSVNCSFCRKKLVQSEKDEQSHFKSKPQYEGKNSLWKR